MAIDLTPLCIYRPTLQSHMAIVLTPLCIHRPTLQSQLLFINVVNALISVFRTTVIKQLCMAIVLTPLCIHRPTLQSQLLFINVVNALISVFRTTVIKQLYNLRLSDYNIIATKIHLDDLDEEIAATGAVF
jgi:hypothetical protein